MYNNNENTFDPLAKFSIVISRNIDSQRYNQHNTTYILFLLDILSSFIFDTYKINMDWKIYAMIVFISHFKLTTSESRHVVGFYSACFNRSNRSIIHEKAALYYNMTKSRMQVPCVRTNCGKGIVIRYEGYDVCEDYHTLLEIFLNLLLDEKYNSIMTKNKTKIAQESGINLITAFLTPWLQKLLFGIDFTKHKIPIAVFNEDIVQLPSTESSYFIIMENSMREDVSTISQVFTNFHWEKVGLLHLENNDYPDQIYSNLYREFISWLPIHHPTLCFYRDNVDVLTKRTSNVLSRTYNKNIYQTL